MQCVQKRIFLFSRLSLYPVLLFQTQPWRHHTTTLISQPTTNQFTPNLFHSLPNTQTHRSTRPDRRSSTAAFPIATEASDIEKNRPFTSEAICRPFSSCSGHTDIQTHSYGREQTVDEAVALERSKSDHYKVRSHVFLLLYALTSHVNSPHTRSPPAVVPTTSSRVTSLANRQLTELSRWNCKNLSRRR